jgi:hypothetical protein
MTNRGVLTLADLQERCKHDDLTDCLTLPGSAKNGSVYVWLPVLARPVPVSRALAVLSGTKLKKGQMLVPTCGNHACANMGHRYVGTRSDLMKEMRPTLAPQHRMRIAASHRAREESKYSPELRRQIIDSDETQQALGAKLGLHPSVIGRIRTGHSWREAAPAASVFTMRP